MIRKLWDPQIVSLYSGIDGLGKGLEAAGLGTVVQQIEIDPFCRRVLERHWPHARRDVIDVREANRANLERADVLCGGFPCQDLSVAGKGAGIKDGSQSSLWSEFNRIVGETKPSIVVVENVAHGRGRWLPYVRRDLHAHGYRTSAYVLAASDVGAPHARRRCFVTAYANRFPLREWTEWITARRARSLCGQGEAVPVDDGCAGASPWSSSWPSRSRIRGVDDGARSRVYEAERLKALGNTVVWQQAELLGKIVTHTIVEKKGCV